MSDQTNPFRLDNQTAIVTGAGKGIGRGIAESLALAGANLVICSRTASELDACAASVSNLGAQAITVVGDITQQTTLDELVEAGNSMGGISIWVNNAGGLPDATPRYLTRTPSEKWDDQMNLNLKAVFLACQTAAQAMDQGAIVNISSRAAQGASIKNGPYAAAKAAVNNLTQTFALELAPKIRVNAIAPGPIPTDNFNESTNFPDDQPLESLLRVPLGRMGTPQDIGNAVVFMASPASSWITGQCLYISGGL